MVANPLVLYNHPARYYVRFLAVVDEEFTLTEVNRKLRLLGLAAFEEAQFEREVQEMLERPVDFDPSDRMHLPSVKWLREKKIYSLLHRDESTNAVENILRDTRLREQVERMLIGGVHPRDIAFKYRKAGGPTLDERAIADFSHYFWNTAELGQADWIHYFEATDKSGRSKHLADTALASLVSGPKLATARSGLKIQVDRVQIMQEMMEETYLTFLEIRALPLSEKKVNMLTTVVRGFARLDERVQTTGNAALQDVLDKFKKFRVLSDSDTVPVLTDLAPRGTISLGDEAGDRAKEKKG